MGRRKQQKKAGIALRNQPIQKPGVHLASYERMKEKLFDLQIPDSRLRTLRKFMKNLFGDFAGFPVNSPDVIRTMASEALTAYCTSKIREKPILITEEQHKELVTMITQAVTAPTVDRSLEHKLQRV